MMQGRRAEVKIAYTGKQRFDMQDRVAATCDLHWHSSIWYILHPQPPHHLTSLPNRLQMLLVYCKVVAIISNWHHFLVHIKIVFWFEHQRRRRRRRCRKCLSSLSKISPNRRDVKREKSESIREFQNEAGNERMPLSAPSSSPSSLSRS